MNHSEENPSGLDANLKTRSVFVTASSKDAVAAKSCEHCSDSFHPRRRNQKYCSNSCRVMACYQRKDYHYQSGRYVKSDQQTALQTKEETLSSLVPKEENPSDSFSLKRTGEAALGSAAVETAKYFIHDKPMMKKIDKILSTVSKEPYSKGIQYVGLQKIEGKVVSIFKSAQNSIYLNDQSGKWFKLVSRHPARWQQIKSPLPK